MLRGHMALQVLKRAVAAWAYAFGDPVLDARRNAFLRAPLPLCQFRPFLRGTRVLLSPFLALTFLLKFAFQARILAAP
jgi:hypothetical protein